MSTRRERPPTIIDVARLSGVSKSTVSNVIRGIDGHLSASTRVRVEQAMAELGYRPNALARDLKRQQTATVGVVVGDLTNPFFSQLTQSIQRRLSAAGYAAIISDSDKDDQAGRSPFDVLLEQRVSGILVLHLSTGASSIRDVGKSIPVVLVSATSPHLDWVCTDDARGAALAVAHLVELTHERIAYVSAPYHEPSSTTARRRGWRNALKRAALPTDASAVWNPQSDDDVNALLDDLGAPTAIVVNNDITAVTVIDDLERAGHPVPGRVSVVGFDDIAIAGLRRLALTTVRQPVHELARHGTALLFDRVNGSAGDDGRQIRLEPTLVVRGTTAPPRRAP